MHALSTNTAYARTQAIKAHKEEKQALSPKQRAAPNEKESSYEHPKVSDQELVHFRNLLKKKLGNVTEEQVSIYLDHFLNHYLKEEEQEEPRDDRTSLNSIIDWSDKQQIQNYCVKQE